MKITNLRKKIIFNCIISIVTLSACVGVFYFYLDGQSKHNAKVQNVKVETRQIKNKITGIKNQADAIEKYKLAWSNLDKNKKDVSGVKVDRFNKNLAKIAKEHLVTTADVKIDLPKPLKGKTFNRSTFKLQSTTVSIKFTAIDDTLAMAFTSDFIKSLPGYPVVTSLTLHRTKEYSEQNLIDVNLERIPGFVEGQLDFLWYISKK